MIIDIITILLLILAVVKGYSKGLIVAVASFFAMFIALSLAVKFSVTVMHWLQAKGYSFKFMAFASFIIVVIAALIAIKLGAKLIQKVLQVAMVNWLNQLGGALVFVFMYISIYSLVLFYSIKLQFIENVNVTASKTYPVIKGFGPLLLDIMGSLIPMFKGLLGEIGKAF